MADTTTVKDIATKKMPISDYSKQPMEASAYANMRGVVDWGNLLQFAPYETGYSFLAVINAPYIAIDGMYKGSDDKIKNKQTAFKNLQDAFVKTLEQEFKGLSGIENISSETMEISDGNTSISLLGKVTQPTSSQISMEFTEKTGSPITKYVSTYLRYIRDPKTQAKTYGGLVQPDNAATSVNLAKEVFNMLYVITDSTCLNIEKAFLILNAQPTEAAYSDLYAFNKGEIGTKDITVTFNAFVTDGAMANKIAHAYMRTLVNTADFKTGKINTNSYEMNWSISGLDSKVGNTTDLIFGTSVDSEDSEHPDYVFHFNTKEDDTKDSEGNTVTGADFFLKSTGFGDNTPFTSKTDSYTTYGGI